jgi:hypothetical protein
MFAYCGNEPVEHRDPNGSFVWGIGISGTANAGAGGSSGFWYIKDDDGNSALIFCGYVGGGTPNLSGSVSVLLYSNANTIFEYIDSDCVDVGGSFLHGSIDLTAGYSKDNRFLYGIQGGITQSIKLIMEAEVHGGLTYTSPYKLIKYHGYRVPLNAQLDFFYGVDDETRKILKYTFGFAEPNYGFGGTKVLNAYQLSCLN